MHVKLDLFMWSKVILNVRILLLIDPIAAATDSGARTVNSCPFESNKKQNLSSHRKNTRRTS